MVATTAIESRCWDLMSRHSLQKWIESVKLNQIYIWTLIRLLYIEAFSGWVAAVFLNWFPQRLLSLRSSTDTLLQELLVESRIHGSISNGKLPRSWSRKSAPDDYTTTAMLDCVHDVLFFGAVCLTLDIRIGEGKWYMVSQVHLCYSPSTWIPHLCVIWSPRTLRYFPRGSEVY